MKDIMMQWLKKLEKNQRIDLFSLLFRACNMFAKNLINRNKMDNRAKTDIKTLILCHLYKTISMDISSGNNRKIF